MNPKIISAAVLSLVFIVSAYQTETATQADAPATTSKSDAEKIVTDADVVKNALNVGGKMPSFSLQDSEGKTVSSDELLKKSNLVVIFYRGVWCPFCNLYLQSLQRDAEKIKAAGGEIVAISVENPDKSSGVAKKNELRFTVLSDPNLEVARKFSIVYELPKEADEQYKSKGLDVAENNEMEKAELPLGATYIVRQTGEIVYAFLDTDYKKRAEPEALIENLKKIKNE